MHTLEYYSLGDASEPEGLTVMTLLRDDDTGEPVIQVGDPKRWYKAKLITKERAEEILRGGSQAEGRGLFGVVNAVGKQKLMAKAKQIAAGKEKVVARQVAHQVKKLKKSVASGILEESDIDEELAIIPSKKLRGRIKKEYTGSI